MVPPARCWRWTRSSAVLPAPLSGRDGGSTSGGTAFSPRCPRSKPSGGRSSARRTSSSGVRLSRIYYEGTYYDYPIRLGNALRGLGLVESARCGLSFLCVRVHPPKDLDTFEGWTARAFGWRLYRKFFKTYTEKIWGMPASAIKADWAAQRIKSLTLGKAIRNALAPNKRETRVTSLIDEFHYPRLGPGMMWERARELVEAQGSKVLFGTRLERIRRSDGRAPASRDPLSAFPRAIWRRCGRGGRRHDMALRPPDLLDAPFRT